MLQQFRSDNYSSSHASSVLYLFKHHFIVLNIFRLSYAQTRLDADFLPGINSVYPFNYTAFQIPNNLKNSYILSAAIVIQKIGSFLYLIRFVAKFTDSTF